MPVLESTDHIIPRSILPHRPTGEGKKPGKKNTAESSIAPVAQRASRLQAKQTEENEPEKNKETSNDKDSEDEVVEVWARETTDVGETKRARASAGQPATATGPKKLPKAPLPSGPIKKTGANTPRRHLSLRLHPLLLLGMGMIAMLVLWTLLTLVANWWSTTWDDIHYGRPRTFQTDVVVGHNDSASTPSHFIALNLNGRIEVIEFPGGDASKARIYIGPQLYGNGQELIPVTLTFVDVNGNHHPDMVVHFQDTRIVYVNDAGGFRPANSNEIQAVQQYLQKHGQ